MQPARRILALTAAAALISAGAVTAHATDSPRTSEPNVVAVTDANFEQDVVQRSKSTMVLLDWGASWCGACKKFKPLITKLAAEGKGTWILADIDSDQTKTNKAKHNIKLLPTVLAYGDAKQIGRLDNDTFFESEKETKAFIDEMLKLKPPTGAPSAPTSAPAPAPAPGKP